MKKLINRLRWVLALRSTQKGVMAFCKLEYPQSDIAYAYYNIMRAHKAEYLRTGSY